jgi:hypothetical protein
LNSRKGPKISTCKEEVKGCAKPKSQAKNIDLPKHRWVLVGTARASLFAIVEAVREAGSSTPRDSRVRNLIRDGLT